MSDEDYSGEWWYNLWRDSCEKREQQRREVEEYWRRLLFDHDTDPTRSVAALKSLPHLTPSKAWRN